MGGCRREEWAVANREEEGENIGVDWVGKWKCHAIDSTVDVAGFESGLEAFLLLTVHDKMIVAMRSWSCRIVDDTLLWDAPDDLFAIR